jgi:hypothetical protein
MMTLSRHATRKTWNQGEKPKTGFTSGPGAAERALLVNHPAAGFCSPHKTLVAQNSARDRLRTSRSPPKGSADF